MNPRFFNIKKNLVSFKNDQKLDSISYEKAPRSGVMKNNIQTFIEILKVR